MKKITLLVLLFCIQLSVAQDEILPPVNTAQEDNNIYDSKGLEIKPEFPGGIEKFHDFFHANFKLPEGLDKDFKGQIILMFVIEKDGSLSDIKVLRDIGATSGKEAVRVIKMAPKWIPGRQNGKIVRVRYALSFKIDSTALTQPIKK